LARAGGGYPCAHPVRCAGDGERPVGALPKGFWDWVISIVVTSLLILVVVALAPFLFLGALVSALIYLGITLLGPLLAAAVLAALKIIILVYIFLMLALFLLLTLAVFSVFLIFLYILTSILDYPLTLTTYFLGFKLAFPQKTIQFEITIVFVYSFLIDLTIPCLKIFNSIDSKRCEFLFSFGIPIDFEQSNLSSNLKILSNKSQKSVKNSTILLNNSQGSNTNNGIDDASYNAGRLIALFVGLFTMYAIATFNYPIYGYILIGTFVTMYLLGLFFIKTNKAFTKGLGLGLFHIGLLYMAPFSPKLLPDANHSANAFGGGHLSHPSYPY